MACDGLLAAAYRPPLHETSGSFLNAHGVAEEGAPNKSASTRR